MGNIPLHPLLVHFPLVLALALPIVLGSLWFAMRRNAVSPRAWWVGVVVAAAMLATAFVAVKTGEKDEEIVEEYVAEEALHTHEERGEAFLWISGGLLLLTALPGVLRHGRARDTLLAAAIVGSLAGAGFAVALGHSGGTLVYEHNAAAAHAGDGAFPGRTPLDSSDDHATSEDDEAER